MPTTNGNYLFCPVCKALTFQTIKRQGNLTFYTCRTQFKEVESEPSKPGCKTTFRRRESLAG